MGHARVPVPFWTEDIRVKRVVEATDPDDFYIAKIGDLGRDRLNNAHLSERDDNRHYVIELSDRTFVEFKRG